MPSPRGDAVCTPGSATVRLSPWPPPAAVLVDLRGGAGILDEPQGRRSRRTDVRQPLFSGEQGENGLHLLPRSTQAASRRAATGPLPQALPGLPSRDKLRPNPGRPAKTREGG